MPSAASDGLERVGRGHESAGRPAERTPPGTRRPRLKRRPAQTAIAALLVLFQVLLGLSFGFSYLPAALLMVIAAVSLLTERRGGRGHRQPTVEVVRGPDVDAVGGSPALRWR